MKFGIFARRAVLTVLAAAIVILVFASANGSVPASGSTIKWADFNVPSSAMTQAYTLDVQSHSTGTQLHWVEILAYLGAKYGGNWKSYRSKDMDTLAAQLKKGVKMSDLTIKLKNYDYFYKVYDAVLGNFVGDYAIGQADESGSILYQQKYGLKVFSPIAGGYGYSHYDDFGNSRSFGFARRHLGNDLMGSIGTPIVAVEGGIIESMGWNQYGGWRIGIRSFDKERYYYYAHLRKDHPYRDGLHQGDIIRSGEVIGYLGMTGYSTKENANNMQKPHLHFGMQLIFDEQQRESNNEIWIDVYDIVNFLSASRSPVKKISNDYYAKQDFLDYRYLLYYE